MAMAKEMDLLQHRWASMNGTEENLLELAGVAATDDENHSLLHRASFIVAAGEELRSVSNQRAKKQLEVERARTNANIAAAAATAAAEDVRDAGPEVLKIATTVAERELETARKC
eukprot:g360.t1